MDSFIRDALTGKLDASMVDARTAPAYMAHSLAISGGGILQLAEPDNEHLVFGALIRAL